MKPRTSRRSSPLSAIDPEDFAFECLSRLAKILVRFGYSPKALVNNLRAICRMLKERPGAWDPSRLSFLLDAPHVTALWHSDPSCLSPGGQPTPLPMRGSGPSLTALIRRVLPRADPDSVVRALMRMRALRRQGTRYLPTGQHLVLRKDNARLHSLYALLGMLRTVERNVTGRKTAALFERSALNPNFPVVALPALHRRVNARASEMLWDFDGYMRRWERRISGGARTRVGVEIFAFEEPAGAVRTGKRVRGSKTHALRTAERRRRRRT